MLPGQFVAQVLKIVAYACCDLTQGCQRRWTMPGSAAVATEQALAFPHGSVLLFPANWQPNQGKGHLN